MKFLCADMGFTLCLVRFFFFFIVSFIMIEVLKIGSLPFKSSLCSDYIRFITYPYIIVPFSFNLFKENVHIKVQNKDRKYNMKIIIQT